MPRRHLTGRKTANEDFDFSKELFSSALSGDAVVVISPLAVDRVATADPWSRDVDITITDAAGNVHEWLTRDFAATLTVARTGAGVIAVDSATLTIVRGRGQVVVSGTGDWVAGNDNTLTVADITISGYTITGGTSVETIVAP